MYVDGNNVGFDNGKTAFYAMTGCAYGGWGMPTQDNIKTLAGQSGTITEGTDYTFMTGVHPNVSLDYVNSNGAKIIFKCQDGKGRGSTYEGKSGNYRLLHLTFMFGCIRGPALKKELMKKIMDYLLGNTPVLEVPEPAPLENRNTLRIVLNNDPGYARVVFTLSAPSWTRVHCCSATGRRIKTLVDDYCEEGSHDILLGRAFFGDISNGRYFIRLETGSGSVFKPILLIQ